MFGPSRRKRTAYLLDETARARIIGVDALEPDYVGGGSEHSGGHGSGDVSSSSSLSEQLFFSFNDDLDGDEDGDSAPSKAFDDGSDCESDHDCSTVRESYDASVEDLIRSIGIDQRDAFRNVLTAHVSRAVGKFGSRVESEDHDHRRRKTILSRNVVAYLRSLGYNAAVCKVTWQKSGGLTAGDHEFIDVVARCADENKTQIEEVRRYLIELHLASEFAIARPTRAYARLVQHVPRVFVGTCDELKLILKTMSDALKVSMKSKGLLLPPWRKHRFVQMKWFGPYRRTVSVFPTSSDSVKCRFVGFDVAANGGCLLTARTR